jgi:uncharacterized protein (TIGR00296 family)
MHVYSIEHGKQLVKAARNCIELSLIDMHFNRAIIINTISEFDKPHGVFVTLKHYPTMSLRGCIGFPRAIGPLNEALVEAAAAAAFADPRFVSVSKKEVDELLVEISILSSPVLVTGNERARLAAVNVPGDGLMVEYGHYSGLLLPIVAVEQKWGKKNFLEETCRKAGLHENYWAQQNVKLYKFETQVFSEESPDGNVIEEKY